MVYCNNYIPFFAFAFSFDRTKILNTLVEDEFTRHFHRYLVASERYSFNEAELTALNNINVQLGSIIIDEIISLLPAFVFTALG